MRNHTFRPSRTAALLLALCTLSLVGCRVSHTISYSTDGFLLREVEGEDGTQTTFRLSSTADSPKLNRTERRFAEVPSLGLRARTIKAGSAVNEHYGIDAFEGVLVTSVQTDSPAEVAGLHAGDVIRRVGERQISSSDHLDYVIQTDLKIGEAVDVEVLRRRNPDEVEGEFAKLVTIVPAAKRVEVSKTDVTPLDHSRTVLRTTGMQVVGLPPELALQIYEENEPVVLLAYVAPGSPAYLAGLRRGDRVLSCDGRPVRLVSELRSSVRARAAKLKLDLDDGEEVSAARPASESFVAQPLDQAGGAGATSASEPSSGPLQLEVDGPLGPHSAKVRLSDELDEVLDFDIPILVEYRSDVDSTRFSFLDFILQFGWNYESRYVQSSTRRPRSSSYFSLFPFGMFEFVRSPKKSESTFFWFITFETKR